MKASNLDVDKLAIPPVNYHNSLYTCRMEMDKLISEINERQKKVKYKIILL